MTLATLAACAPLVAPARADGEARATSTAPDEAGAEAPSGAAPAADPALDDIDPDDEERVLAALAKQPVKEKPAGVRYATITKDGMVRIPGGRFPIGSADKLSMPNERPRRTTVVQPFWLDRTEVTVGAYRVCVERGVCPRPTRSSSSCTFDLNDPALPISCVPWTAANAYCSSVGKRLPREVEWEVAARGASHARYPWGGSGASCGLAVTLAAESTQKSCSGKAPARVGARQGGASPYGVLDMSGNVEEWVADWYGDAVSDLPPRAGASHVLRGGGWLSKPSQARATSRNWGSVREAGPNVGVRCARDDDAGSAPAVGVPHR